MRNSSENKIKIVFIRHGLTPANEAHKYCGRQNDEDLSPAGAGEIIKHKEDGIYPDADILFTSPKIRAIHTAGIVYPGKEYSVISEFDEMDFGTFEGRTHEDLKDTPEYIAWIESNGELPFPGGESRKEYVKRVGAGYERVLRSLHENMLSGEDKDLTIAIVAHGGTIMAVLNEYAGESYFGSMVANGDGFLCEADLDNPYSTKVIGRLLGQSND